MTSLTRRLSAVHSERKASREVTLRFADWRPDLPDYENPAATECKNVIPRALSYGPLPGLSESSDALATRAIGAVAASDSAGNVSIYAGERTRLNEIVADVWTDQSKSGGYSTADDGNWEFALFGETLIATNYDDDVQSVSVGGGAFADLITSTRKPKARHIDIVRDFAVLGNTNDTTDGLQTGRVWWSAIDDPADFDPDVATLCGFQDLPEGGWVQAIVGGVEYGLIFQERIIRRMTFEGAPTIFRFDAIDRKRGTPIPNSVVGHGRNVYFISEEGFQVTDGFQTRSIGANRVDRTFWNQFDLNDISRVSSAIDPLNKLVIWAFPGTGNVSSAPNKLFIYNWQDDKWAQADVDTNLVFAALGEGYTLDTLDTVSTDLDALAFSLDSRAWTGGEAEGGAISSDRKMATFSGANLAATLETGEVEFHPGRRSTVTELRPLVDGGTVTCQIGGRSLLTASNAYDSAASVNAAGVAPVRNNNRYHRALVSIAAGGTWSHAQGVKAVAKPTGRR